MAQLIVIITLAVWLCCLVAGALSWLPTSPPTEYSHNVDLPTKKPLIIAHRGASGLLPEHTVEAYTMAVQQGADVIECDVAMTKDLKMICFHDNWMTKMTDAAELFPERLRTYFVTDQNGSRNVTAYFTFDFTLEELKRLRVKQSFEFRDAKYNGMFQIATLEEYIQVAKDAGRPVGIYPETKQPVLINSLDIMRNANTTFEELLIGVLKEHGYTKKTDPCFLQSFNAESLEALSKLSELPLVFLMMTSVGIPNNVELERWSKIYYGLGLSKGLIVEVGDDGWIANTTDFIARAHRLGMKIHPYSFRNENRFLAWDYQQDAYKEMEQFLNLGVDGYFTDFSGTCANFLSVAYSKCEVSTNGGRSASYILGVTMLGCALSVMMAANIIRIT